MLPLCPLRSLITLGSDVRRSRVGIPPVVGVGLRVEMPAGDGPLAESFIGVDANAAPLSGFTPSGLKIAE